MTMKQQKHAGRAARMLVTSPTSKHIDTMTHLKSHSSHTGALDHSDASHRSSSSSGTSTPSSSPSVSRSFARLLSLTSLDFKPLSSSLPCHIARLNNAPPKSPKRLALIAACLPSLRKAFYEQGADVALSFSGITLCGPPPPSPASAFLTHTALASDNKPVINATDNEVQPNSGVGISPALGLAPDPITLPPPSLRLRLAAARLFPAIRQGLLDNQEEQEAAHRERSSTSSDGSPGTPAGFIQPGLLGAHPRLTPANLIGSGTFGSVYRLTLDQFPQLGQMVLKEVLLCGEAGQEEFAEEGCMAAQMSLEGGLQVFHMAIAPGPALGQLRGLLYMQQGECSLEDVMNDMAAEHTRRTAAWENTPHISSHALNHMYATIQLMDATTAIGHLADCARELRRVAKINVIHGDVKPANFVLVNGEVKIIDFGLAVRRVAGERLSAHKGGSDEYMAPECLDGLELGQDSATSSTTDILAFGIMCIKWLEYGVGGDCMCILHALAAYFPQLPAMLQRMLHTDPIMRPSPEEVAAEFVRMHSVLLEASADTASSARYIMEQVGTAGSKASECAAQLHSFTQFLESRSSLREAVADTDRPLSSLPSWARTWLLWDQVGCSDQLPGYLIGMACRLLPWTEARERVEPCLPFVAWADMVMTACKRGWMSQGKPTSLREEWLREGSTLDDQLQRRFQRYPL
ncbi:MAG: hypothetical protein WDW36_004568 [Sanguina aurantia]